jgi:hypothetical protein
MKPVSIEIVPALPGFLTIYDYPESEEIETAEPVIAWRIETYSIEDSDELFSSCIPLMVGSDGDPAPNCIGIRNPDMTVTLFDDSNYDSIEKLQQLRYPQK